MSKERRQADKAIRRRRRLAADRRAEGKNGRHDPDWRKITVSVESDGYATRTDLAVDPEAFHNAPTDEPGTLFGCDECGASLYLEGLLPMSPNVQDLESSRVRMIDGCPDCGSTMFGARIGLETKTGVFVTTHTFVVDAFLKVLLDDLQSGKITPDEAVEKIAKAAPVLHPLVEWIERRGVTLTLLVTVLLATLTYANQQDNQSLTPEDVTKIVKLIEDDDASLTPEDVTRIVEAIEEDPGPRGRPSQQGSDGKSGSAPDTGPRPPGHPD